MEKQIFVKKKFSFQIRMQSSRGGLGGKAITMFKHSCHFSPGELNPAWGIVT